MFTNKAAHVPATAERTSADFHRILRDRLALGKELKAYVDPFVRIYNSRGPARFYPQQVRIEADDAGEVVSMRGMIIQDEQEWTMSLRVPMPVLLGAESDIRAWLDRPKSAG